MGREIKVKAPTRGVKYTKTRKGEVTATRKIKGDEARVLRRVPIKDRPIDEPRSQNLDVLAIRRDEGRFHERPFGEINGLVRREVYRGIGGEAAIVILVMDARAKIDRIAFVIGASRFIGMNE